MGINGRSAWGKDGSGAGTDSDNEDVSGNSVQNKDGRGTGEGGNDVPEMGRGQQSGINPEVLDVSLGMSYTGDNEEAYRNILGSYLKNSRERLEEIRRLCAEEIWKDYVTQVHALKSTSLTIGAKTLSAAAAELEKAGKEGDYGTIRSKNEELLVLYQNVIETGIQEMESMAGKTEDGASHTGGEETVSKKGEISEEELKKCLSSMKDAAENFDSDTLITLCEKLSGYCFKETDLKELLLDVKSAVEEFEYEQAEKNLEQVFAKLLSDTVY